LLTEPYRAPEIVLGSSDPTTKVDVWALACVLWATLFHNHDLFGLPGTIEDDGESRSNHLHRMIQVRGTPEARQFEGLSDIAITILRQLPKVDPIDLSKVLPTTYVELGIGRLLEGMLKFSPDERWDIHTVLSHPFVAQGNMTMT
jgi:serine/threonine protein kinase